jgi:uncharacterized protein involved in exopolysaccharide biosynthesis
MNNQEFSPYNSMEHVLRHWWVVVALMVAGGLVGFLFHLFLHPVYEAKAYIAINLDCAKRQLTQIEEDHAFNAASDIITSNSIMNLVIGDANIKGYSITPSQYRRDFYLEGRQSVWEPRVRDQDPKASATLTNIPTRTLKVNRMVWVNCFDRFYRRGVQYRYLRFALLMGISWNDQCNRCTVVKS